MANTQCHFGQLIKNIKPMNAKNSPAAAATTIRVQTRIVPMVAITWTSLILVSGYSPATLF
ncbi:hypothetical protein ACEPFB_003597 [Salmonella enterica]|uniref:hypothetical protein n=1 Tax=Enterobacter asburiae TaxID=61645 RepID=UPI000FD9EBB1|nr:hypothetical protein [Enterobacter asburiae]HBM7636588.1 hypothetical protein [Enterobacter asburiae]